MLFQVPLSNNMQLNSIKFSIMGSSRSRAAPDGWNFKNRHDIKQFTICGDARSEDTEAAEAYPGELKKIIEKQGYLSSQMYNCDKTELNCRMLPEKSFTQPYDNKSIGFKQCKNSLTALLCCNGSGSHKPKPLIIRNNKFHVACITLA